MKKKERVAEVTREGRLRNATLHHSVRTCGDIGNPSNISNYLTLTYFTQLGDTDISS